MIIEKTVFVFDICSSTKMMEDAQTNSFLENYYKMIDDILDFLKKVKKEYNFEIYKFLGDGFILLFNKKVNTDKIYRFSEELIDIANKIIVIFISKNMQDTVLPRIGITIGVESGILYKQKGEYIGRAINIACRLQGKLNLKDSINKIIISKNVYNKIVETNIKKQFKYLPKKLRNVDNEKEFKCYESSPIVTTDSFISNNENNYIATASSTVETLDTGKGSVIFIVKRNNGQEVYSSSEFQDTDNINDIMARFLE